MYTILNIVALWSCENKNFYNTFWIFLSISYFLLWSSENRRPRLLPWRATYKVTKGQPWELAVQAVDPEGCSVNVTVDTSRAGHVTSTRLSERQVRLTLQTQRLGSYKARVTARDQCGAEYSQNYHIMVSLKWRECQKTWNIEQRGHMQFIP